MSEPVLRQNSAVDLSSCDREPIHIPGSIQPHGCLFAVRDSDLIVLQVSANVHQFFGEPPDEVLGKAVQATLGGEIGPPGGDS